MHEISYFLRYSHFHSKHAQHSPPTTHSFPCALPVWAIRKTQSWIHSGKVLLVKYICTTYWKTFSSAIAHVYSPRFCFFQTNLLISTSLRAFIFHLFIYQKLLHLVFHIGCQLETLILKFGSSSALSFFKNCLSPRSPHHLSSVMVTEGFTMHPKASREALLKWKMPHSKLSPSSSLLKTISFMSLHHQERGVSLSRKETSDF